MTKRQPELSKVRFGQRTRVTEVDVILGKYGGVAAQA
jgi:hypothetical protein